MWYIAGPGQGCPLLDEIIARPDSVMSRGRVLKHDGTTTVILLEEQGRRWVVKRYNTKNRWHAVRRTLRTSRALTCWRAATWLEQAGIDTPRPVAALEERRCGVLRGRSYFACEFVEGQTLDEALRSGGRVTGGRRDEELIEQAARIVRQLREHGIVHGDLKATNFIVGKDRVFLADLDAARRHSGGTLAAGLRKDRERFLRNWADDPALMAAFSERLSA
ncbi:MAG: lipopolysaccharide kinase InaA family protein [Arenicellales bacterium]